MLPPARPPSGTWSIWVTLEGKTNIFWLHVHGGLIFSRKGRFKQKISCKESYFFFIVRYYKNMRFFSSWYHCIPCLTKRKQNRKPKQSYIYQRNRICNEKPSYQEKRVRLDELTFCFQKLVCVFWK